MVAAVAKAIHLVDDRDLHIAGSQEVGVEGVHRSLHGLPRRDEGLAGDLAAEDALPVLVRADAPEQVDFELLQIEERDEAIQRFGHGAGASPRRRGRRSLAAELSRPEPIPSRVGVA